MNGAAQNGRAFRDDVRALLRLRGLEPVQTEYRPIWATSRHVAESCIVDYAGQSRSLGIECRFQHASGSADTKIFADLYSAARSLDCHVYVVLLGGQHWQTQRGQAVANAARTFASELTTETKALNVMSIWELREWLKEP